MRTTMLLAAVAAGALLAGVLTATASAATAATALKWSPCKENAHVECSTVTVPVDWANPAGATIDVAIARQRAADPIGTLVFMPGGPGDSGVDRVIRQDAVPPDLAARFDVVSLDPRGVRRSHPVTCDADLVDDMPDADPEAGATLASLQDYARRLGDSCRAHTGPLIDHLDSVSVARDVDAIRAALGERQLTFYGRSYGTLAEQMYAELFPSRVRAMVLDSVFDHSLRADKILTTEAGAAQDTFDEFADWCAADASCALHGRDVGQVFGELYERSVAGRLTEPGDPTRVVAPMTLINDTISYFYDPEWPQAAEYLAGLESGGTAAVRAEAATEQFPLGSFCADHAVRIDSARQWLALWHRQGRFAPTIRAHFAWQVIPLCSAWPAETGNPEHRPNTAGAPPILVLNSRHDPATPHDWATNVTRQLDPGVLVTYDGWGHGVLTRGPCMLSTATRYLVDREPPPPGTHCPAV